ncbi:MAG: efflux RND transporter periplasmic adaptor subunit [Planctomycetes bacterium]|nr:efflux RND transporter periplasmic adaptor subunit [Planctomycetota bacterium]
MRTLTVYAVALLAVVAALWVVFPEWLGLGKSQGEAVVTTSPPAAAPVVVAKVVNAPFLDVLDALGTAVANESVVITPNRPDHIVSIAFRGGQKVAKGDLLVEMNAAEEKAQLAEATAMLEDRKLGFDRAKDLFDKGLTSEREHDTAKSLLAASKAHVSALQAAIADRQIRAPFAGVLGLRRVSVGAWVQPSTVITSLDDLSVVKVDFTIPETWLGTVESGMRVVGRCVAWPDRTFPGKVALVDTRLDPRTRAATVRAVMPNPDAMLRPGMLMTVRIERGQHQVLQIPEEALIPIADAEFVYRVGKDSIVERVRVKVGRRRVGTVVVESGLAAGDTVVTEGLVRVRHGSPVRIVKVSNSNP